ncbi:RNA polymerase sigma factor [Planctomycetota bacterium]
MQEKIPDQELLKAYHQGNHRAYARWFERYERSAYAFLMAVSDNEHEAEDIFQAALMKMLRRLDLFVTARNFKSYFFTFLRNEALDYQQNRKHTRYLNKDHLSSRISLFEWKNKEQPTQLQSAMSAMDRLPPADRQILVLRIFQGMKFREISEVLAVPIQTLQSRYAKALKKIKGIMSRGDM